MVRQVIDRGVGRLWLDQLNDNFEELYLNMSLGLSIAKGDVPLHSVTHKFGFNSAVGTTLEPICVGGIYRTPQVSGATALRIKSGGDVADTAAGAGAREITLQGLDETGALVSESLATAGASASAATSATFIRLFRAFVSESGVYATQSVGSHVGDVVIENAAGGTDWATIDSGGFPNGQSNIGAYTVPLGSTAYVTEVEIEIESTKSVDVLLFQRADILSTSAPYSAMREFSRFTGVSENASIKFETPQRFEALTDIGALAATSAGTASVSIDMEIILVQDA